MPMGAAVHANLSAELTLRFPSFECLKTLYGLTEVMLVSFFNDSTALGELDPGGFQNQFAQNFNKRF